MPTIKFEFPGNPAGPHEKYNSVSGKGAKIIEGTQRVIDSIEEGTGKNRDDIQRIFEEAAE